MSYQLFAAGNQVLSQEQSNGEQTQARYTPTLNGMRDRISRS
jgi:hypothetical protein